jgi:hypothetical protein
MSKFYFREDVDECCYTKKQIIEDMKDECITELKIFDGCIQHLIGAGNLSILTDSGKTPPPPLDGP